MDPHTAEDIVNARAARDVLGWTVRVDRDLRRIIGGLPPGTSTGLCPIPPFASNWKAAMKLRDRVCLMPAKTRAVFLEELHKLVAEGLGGRPIPGPELVLWASPQDITLAALKAVSA
jgi:hypothetical protein